MSSRLGARVLVVDDSALVRQTVSRLIEEDPCLEVVGAACNGVQALERVAELAPDVVSLDLDMPVMDGITCLGHLVRKHSQRVVILSTLAEKSSFTTFKALAMGAVDFVTKPVPGRYLGDLASLGVTLRAKIRAAAGVATVGPARPRAVSVPARPSGASGGHGSSRSGIMAMGRRPRAVVGVGGSTGGTVAVEALLRCVPAALPLALVVVLHIPPGFSRYLARYLDGVCAIDVREAVDGAEVRPNVAFIAPGGSHLLVQRRAGGLRLRIDSQAPHVRGYRPSINSLFYSLAGALRSRGAGVLLSGMGEDGVNGLEAIHQLGGATFVQDRDSSVIFDIASRAVARNVVDYVLPPEAVAERLVRSLGDGIEHGPSIGQCG